MEPIPVSGLRQAMCPNLPSIYRAWVEIYRLMQFAFRDVLEVEFGTEKADEIFYKAGKLAGEEYYIHEIKEVESFNELVNKLQKSLIGKRPPGRMPVTKRSV